MGLLLLYKIHTPFANHGRRDSLNYRDELHSS